MADLTATSTDLVPTRIATPVASASALDFAGMISRARAFARQPAVAKSLPMLGLIGVLAAAALAWAMLHTPPQRTLFAGLADADKASVAQALGTAGIPYSIDRDTGALSVSDDKFYQAKMLLAQQGLPKSAPDGDAILSALPMGASRAVESERLQDAREMDLARTIEAIDSVESAKVHLAVEQPSVFLRDQAKPSASVMLRLRGGAALSNAQVQAILHLVASSVPGLSPDNISIVDQDGDLLSKTGNDDSDDRQVALQAKVEARYRQALATLLTPIVGAGNFTAEVHADLDFSETALTRETYPKDSAIVRNEQGSWTNLSDADKTPAGVPGAITNQAPATGSVASGATNTPGQAPVPVAPTTAPGQASANVPNKTNETYNRSFDVGHEVSVTRNPTGSLRRLSVAVALKELPGGKKRTPAEIAAIEALVKGAVGYDQSRGDVVALSARSFAPDAADPAAKWYQASWLPMVGRNVGAVLVALIIVFGLGRPLLKRRAAAIAAAPAAAAAAAEPDVANQIAAALADQANTGSTARKVTLDMIEGAPGYAARAALIRDFVRQDPDRAALVVRDLIRSDMPGAEAN